MNLNEPLHRSFLGDAGHFIKTFRAIYVNNPHGRPFTFTAHRYIWPPRGEDDGLVTIYGPEGAEVGRAEIGGDDDTVAIDVDAGQKGVFAVRAVPMGRPGKTDWMLNWWFECTLEQMVLDTGDWEERQGREETFDMFVVTAPRRWYFFVPEGAPDFQVASNHGMAHRQDSGLVVCSPRGQPMAAHYGSRPRAQGRYFQGRYNMTPVRELEDREPGKHVMQIETDPGTTGRFWSLWLCGGEGHCYSPFQVLLNGVPTYLSSMPEQWFNPQTGRPAPVVEYDYHIGPAQRTSETFFAPAPILGDTDTGMRGKHTVHLRNPENRPFDFRVSGYMMPPDTYVQTRMRATGPQGEELATAEGAFGHKSPPSGVPISVPAVGPGVYRVEVDAARWFGWSEPVMPAVVAGIPTADGGFRFSLMLAIARHWFFGVPEGVTEFVVRVDLADPNHVLHVEVHAPDRIMQLLYAEGGESREVHVSVPQGLANRVWFLKLAVGSSTRLLGQGADNPRTVQVDPDIQLFGVPGYVAPTWEQWFNPDERV